MSESEEMYLVTIARLREASEDALVPLAQLASEMEVQPVSVNQMVRKMEEAGFLSYTPYKGVGLTEAGQRVALRILRHRRLWEVFLVDKLKFLPEEAPALACSLEHTIPTEAAERLAAFLGNPANSPQGKPIPEAEPDYQVRCDIALSQLGLDEERTVSAISADTAARSFLAAQGIATGKPITILAKSAGGDLLVQAQGGENVYLLGRLVNTIWVSPVGLSN